MLNCKYCYTRVSNGLKREHQNLTYSNPNQKVFQVLFLKEVILQTRAPIKLQWGLELSEAAPVGHYERGKVLLSAWI
jgi:hypothetical protein